MSFIVNLYVEKKVNILYILSFKYLYINLIYIQRFKMKQNIDNYYEMNQLVI